nr:hypothetical protein [Ramlibacter sp.]
MANAADTRAKRLLRGTGLVLAAGAAYWVGSALNAPRSADDVVAPATPARARAAVPASSPRKDEPWMTASAGPVERFSDTAVHNPFASLNVAPPAPPPAPKAPVPKPAR